MNHLWYNKPQGVFMRQEVKDWIESAEYDLEMAKVMLEAKRSNSCVLMGHQAVETIP